jgi:hypothetical protein
MSKRKLNDLQDELSKMAVPTQEAVAPIISAVPRVEKLLDADKSVLDIAKAKKELALTQAKLAIAQSESAGLTYDNIVLQLAMKYQLKEGNIISEDGTIIRQNNK